MPEYVLTDPSKPDACALGPDGRTLTQEWFTALGQHLPPVGDVRTPEGKHGAAKWILKNCYVPAGMDEELIVLLMALHMLSLPPEVRAEIAAIGKD